MENNNRHEQSFSLCNEKVRSIVGQMPSSLIRYGISIIGTILVFLFFVTYFLPYRQVYSGTAVVYRTPIEPSDSIEITVYLKFDNKHPQLQYLNNSPIIFQSTKGTINGTIKNISAKRDINGRQKALCYILQKESRTLENSEVDFDLTIRLGTIWEYFAGTTWNTIK